MSDEKQINEEVKEEALPQVTLDGIIKQVLDALTKVNSLIEVYNKRIDLVKARESAVIDRESVLKTQTDEFSIREAAVLKIEDSISLKKEAEKLIEEAKSLKASAKADKDAFDGYKVSETARLNEMRLVAQRESDNVVLQKNAIDEEVQKRVSEALKNMGIKVK